MNEVRQHPWLVKIHDEKRWVIPSQGGEGLMGLSSHCAGFPSGTESQQSVSTGMSDLSHFIVGSLYEKV